MFYVEVKTNAGYKKMRCSDGRIYKYNTYNEASYMGNICYSKNEYMITYEDQNYRITNINKTLEDILYRLNNNKKLDIPKHYRLDNNIIKLFNIKLAEIKKTKDDYILLLK